MIMKKHLNFYQSYSKSKKRIKLSRCRGVIASTSVANFRCMHSRTNGLIGSICYDTRDK